MTDRPTYDELLLLNRMLEMYDWGKAELEVDVLGYVRQVLAALKNYNKQAERIPMTTENKSKEE